MANGRARSLLRLLPPWLGVLLLLPLIAVLLPFLLLVGTYERLRGAILNHLFRRHFASRGTPAILVYSNSPNWQSYFEENVLPRVRQHAVILNWSERHSWRERRSLPVRVYEHHRPHENFNPYALIFGPKGAPSRVEFFEALRDDRHGRPHELRRALTRLFTEVEQAVSAWDAGH
jgi:hypothetical protein